uniref:Uncharacterized protein n=1 Tax=Pseudomonas phage HRDY3 TaxID=3236930 RepID=A0AB39CE67_9VIRU
MQTGKMELMSQQVVLAFLGYYSGAIDGIWSDASMKAKRAFEADDSYVPGIPSYGMPFALLDKLPRGLKWEKKLLTHRDLTPEKAQEILRTRTRPTKPAPVVEEPVEEEFDEEEFDHDDAQE